LRADALVERLLALDAERVRDGRLFVAALERFALLARLALLEPLDLLERLALLDRLALDDRLAVLGALAVLFPLADPDVFPLGLAGVATGGSLRGVVVLPFGYPRPV